MARTYQTEGFMKVCLGMSPIAWSNDDLPELGGETSLETCLHETRSAGYTGTETGGKFPRDVAALGEVLQAHDLKLVSGWYSGTLLGREVEEEKERIAAQLQLFSALGASVMVYGETWNTVQNRRDRTLSQRPVIDPADIPAYGRRLSVLAAHCQEHGVPLVFHHHMGTGVETEAELDLVMSHTGEEVGLLLDTGHLCFAGGDIARVIEHHGRRIKHVHAKDIREDVLSGVDRERMSFLDCVLDGVFTVPGDGMIDFIRIAQCLAAVGYEGWVIVEAEQDPARANPFEYAKKGYRTLESALTGAGYEISAR